MIAEFRNFLNGNNFCEKRKKRVAMKKHAPYWCSHFFQINPLTMGFGNVTIGADNKNGSKKMNFERDAKRLTKHIEETCAVMPETFSALEKVIGIAMQRQQEAVAFNPVDDSKKTAAAILKWLSGKDWVYLSTMTDGMTRRKYYARLRASQGDSAMANIIKELESGGLIQIDQGKAKLTDIGKVILEGATK